MVIMDGVLWDHCFCVPLGGLVSVSSFALSFLLKKAGILGVSLNFSDEDFTSCVQSGEGDNRG